MKKKKVRPTIGFLTDWSEQDYQTNLREGVIDAAEAYDANLFCFVGGALRSTNAYEAQRNVLYDLINEDNIDGIIVMSASIGHFISYEEIVDFCHSFKHIPIVSIALPIEGIPSVLVNQEMGMRLILNHLIETHHYEKIAFITGPKMNPEAIQRYTLYKEQLEQHGIPFDPDLVVHGEFIMLSGINAIKTLIDERKVEFDVVFAANDVMALGALIELQNRKIYVPGKVAVVGFDDIEEGRYYSPPLTTVTQPLYEQGRRAMEILLAKIEGEEVPEKIFLDTEIKIRESCGCLPERVLNAAVGEIHIIENNFEDAFIVHKDEIATRIEAVVDTFLTNKEEHFDTGWTYRLLNSFYSELIKQKEGKFLKTLNSIIYRSMDGNTNISAWQRVISTLRCHTVPCLSNNRLLSKAEDLWHQARIMIGDITQRVETLRRLNLEVENLSMRNLSEELNTKIGIEQLLEVVFDNLPKIGIESAFIILYNDAIIPGESSRLILAYNENGLITLDAGGTIYPSRIFIPGNHLPKNKRYIYMVESFYYGQHHIGYGLFEMGPKDGAVYELLRVKLSSSLRGGLLLKQVQDQAHCLEEQVKERTRDLTIANEKLIQEIGERKKAESALIRSNEDLQSFAYIASHDLQEPLRMIAGYVGLLERRYKDKLDQNANEFIEFVVDGAKRMQHMINDLLLFSRVSTKGKSFENIAGDAIIKQAVSNLQAMIEENKASVTWDPLPVIYVDSSQLTQVFQNLLSNAIKFHGDNPPEIHIGCKKNKTNWIFSVRDNGIGIEPEFKDKIFIMFKRLHGRGEYPGSGIGLTICQRIVERHGGHIWVESQPNQGSTFYFTIPQ
ncbi:MAG: substrate-binding domain-containing protein [Spirochaetales bacterium]|nr:substrate-binding domain-containing protein [Spirochaetales bacterium]